MTARLESAGRLFVEDRGAVRVLTVSNPARRNALDFGLLRQLRAALVGSVDDGVRCLVLRGEGDKAFCAGMDLNAVHGSHAGGAQTLPAIEEMMQAVEAAPPVIAYLNGVAYGAGCELACACDLRVARPGISLCVTPTKLGLVYSAEGIARVAAVVGLARARRMFLTAQPVDARTALEWGLVDELLPARKAWTLALALAQTIAENAPLALMGTKRALAMLGRPRLERREREEILWLQKTTFASDDAREAMDAFVHRRKPRFQGR